MTRETDEDERSGTFTPLQAIPEPVAAAPPPIARSGYLVYRAEGGFEAAVPVAVVERCVAWGLQAEPNEWYGLVIGKLCEAGGRRHVVVLGVVPDPGAKGHPGSVETTSDSEFRTRMSARLLYPDGIVLGWVHGHLRHGVRFSSTDQATQRTWTQPHALGIVVDPWNAKRLAVYRGPDSELMTLVEEVPAPAPCGRSEKPSRLRRLAARVRAGAARRRRPAVRLAALGVCLSLLYVVRQLSKDVSALKAVVETRGFAFSKAAALPDGGPPVGASADAAPEKAGVCRGGEEVLGGASLTGGGR